MTADMPLLLTTAASLGFIHTILGPDHYIPFIMMARAREWSVPRTLWITFFCGIGHILSSVALGIIGISFGLAVSHLEVFESFRGNVAAWLLIVFGFAYFIYGLKVAYRHHRHVHAHHHDRDAPDAHAHLHTHDGGHLHVHDEEGKGKHITPWVLFTIFLFGPCESLIPILMYPAANHSAVSLALVTSVFGGMTILTMITVVIVSLWGINLLPFSRFEKYTHALAGFSIFLCGLAIQFLGL